MHNQSCRIGSESNCESYETQYQASSTAEKLTEGLTDYSPSDAPWDTHRSQTADVSDLYATCSEFERYAERMDSCSGRLLFGWDKPKDTGETRLKLCEAHFCRVRHCPTCQWRRSLMWQARFYESLPQIVQAYPKARWLFLTLTVRNCQITDLGETLSHMNKAFQRLKDRKEFKPVTGWIRTTEVTKSKDGSAHPHFHVLLMVPPSMLSGKNYIKHSRWVDLWADCLRIHYSPNVDIRTVKSKALPNDQDTPTEAVTRSLQNAVAETLKYSTKPSDMTDSNGSDGWFLELTRQTHKRRFIATGGALKDVLKVDEESDDDLALTDGDGTDDTSKLAFDWKLGKRRYMRNAKGDQS